MVLLSQFRVRNQFQDKLNTNGQVSQWFWSHVKKVLLLCTKVYCQKVWLKINQHSKNWFHFEQAVLNWFILFMRIFSYAPWARRCDYAIGLRIRLWISSRTIFIDLMIKWLIGCDEEEEEEEKQIRGCTIMIMTHKHLSRFPYHFILSHSNNILKIDNIFFSIII